MPLPTTRVPSLPAPSDRSELPYTDAELAQRNLSRPLLPRHVAIIMDGNGRWAQAQGRPRIEGHEQGVQRVRPVVSECSRLGIDQLTLYCLSSENWKRPEAELQFLMELFRLFLIQERPEMLRLNLRFSIIGQRTGIPDSVLEEVDRTALACQHNSGTHLCLAVNYGGRQELTSAVRAIAAECAAGRQSIGSIDEKLISNNLYTAGSPDPDLVVRTAGEMRVSNFLLWQISYSELWVTETCWPEFTIEHLHAACQSFGSRQRRFGGLNGV